jgi:hypothetical protein
MNIGSGAMKWLVYIALAYALAQTPAFGADLATPTADATASAEDAGRAEALLQRAVARHRDIKDPALARATPAQAQALLARAVHAVRADPGKALDAFNTLWGPYAEDDLYVFVIGISDKVVRANGADPRLTGIDTDALSLRAPGGKFVQELIVAAGQRDQGEMDYAWPNPVTGNVENKHVFLRKIDDIVVGIGYYAR